MNGADVRTPVAAAAATLLGALALSPVFTSRAWVPPVVTVVVAVLAGGLALRAAVARLTGDRPLGLLGALAVPVGQLALVTCVLAAVFVPDTALAGLVPTPATLTRLGEVFTAGTAEIREQATPALPLTGLLALTTLFVGLVAVVVDLLAVTGRQAAVAGAALLPLVCVPVATVTGGIGLVALVGPAAGFAVLLWADQRRMLQGSAGGAGTAVRIGVVAVAAGAVVGTAVPTLPEGSFATGLGGGTGSATGTSLDPAAELRGQLTLPEPVPLLRLGSSVEDPGYLRAVALDEYEPATGWSLSNLDGETSVADDGFLAPLPDGQPTRQVSAEVQVLEHDDRFLPVPTSPLSIRVAGEEAAWRFDDATGTVFGRDVTSAGLAYRVTAVEPRPSEELLSGALPLPADDPVQERFGVLPQLDPAIAELTAGLTAGASTPYEQVLRIQRYLTDRANGFVYSLSTAPGTSGDDLVDFLRLKRGYCEQYAGAMAVLVRQTGLPARVALGYTPGEVQPDGTRLVTSDDAHAWVEVYFQGVGWVPFDPTPLAADRQVELPWSPRTTAEERVDAAPAVPAAPTTPPPALPRTDRLPGAVPQATPAAGTATDRGPLLVGAGLLALGGAAVAAPAVVRTLQRRRRLAGDAATGSWAELCATATDLGVHLQPSWTPRRVAEALVRAVSRGPGGPAAESSMAAVRRLAQAEEAASYGRPGSAPPPAELRTALRTARRGLLASRPRTARLRALLWPASLVAGTRARVARWTRDRFDRAGRRAAGGSVREGSWS
ncbi:transglutaminaseTgpA domain-containing protein [Blastococcus sp. SYSU DS0510]